MCVSDSLAMKVPSAIPLSDVQVMKRLNPLGDMPTASVPHVDMNGAKNEKAIPSDNVEPNRPTKLG